MFNFDLLALRVAVEQQKIITHISGLNTCGFTSNKVVKLVPNLRVWYGLEKEIREHLKP